MDKGLISSKWFILLAFLAAFLFRLGFGLLAPSNRSGNDQQQTYLIGLQAYTTHTWPYFGPDTIEPTDQKTYESQIPGALEGCLIAVALQIWPNPIAPWVLLNLLTFGSFLAFGWYCCRRAPGLSPWFVYAWLFTAPWNTHVSTQVHNLSFGAVGSLVFFLGFMESAEEWRGDLIPRSWANALMGFGFFWLMQFHLSWVLFAVLVAFSFFLQTRKGRLFQALGAFALGSILPLVFLVPTYLKYGFQMASDSSGLLVSFNFGNFKQFFTLLARYLSFACCELPRWIGDHTADRMAFLLSAYWLLVPAAILLVTGWAQALALLVLGFRKDKDPQWVWVRGINLGLFLLTFLSFCFTVRQPDAHRYYLLFPFVFYYSFLCWNSLAPKLLWRRVACALMVLFLFFQVGYVAYYANLNNNAHLTSNYLADRDKIAKAIALKDYHQLADRWSFSLY